MKIIKKVLLALVILLIIAQFLGPEKNNGNIASIDAFYAETNPPEDVKLILKNACFDCHSNVTRYPWYNSITPLNYWLNHHIEEGKEHFNVSNWEGNSIKRKDHKFEELIEEVEEGKMPLNSYTWTHADAKLTPEQVNALITWAKQVRTSYDLKQKPE